LNKSELFSKDFARDFPVYALNIFGRAKSGNPSKSYVSFRRQLDV